MTRLEQVTLDRDLAALGMAVARDQHKEDNRVVRWSRTAASRRMAFEALQNAGHLGTDLLVVLNDNEMFISNRVGALALSSPSSSPGPGEKVGKRSGKIPEAHPVLRLRHSTRG